MRLKDEQLWNEYVAKNLDPYGKCCVDIARRVMEILDEDAAPVTSGYDKGSAHELICRADKEIDAGGITGFMADAAAHMVAACHERGREFQVAWNGDETEGTKNYAVLTVGNQ